MKTQEEMVALVKQVIKEQYNPRHASYIEIRSQGNSSDVFEDGCDCGRANALYMIGDILGMDLEEPEESDYEY